MQDAQKIEDALLMYNEELEKSLEHLKSEYQMVRAGRANPHILDKVMVEYYGTMTPINQMANISVPEARILAISVWDISQLRNVSKAISVADLGVQPIDDGKVIRLVFPPLTEERRRDIVKQVKKSLEETKVVMRNARRDAIDMFKEFRKNSEISEDEYSGFEKDIQKELDAMTAKLDKLAVDKEKEIMEI